MLIQNSTAQNVTKICISKKLLIKIISTKEDFFKFHTTEKMKYFQIPYNRNTFTIFWDSKYRVKWEYLN